MEQDIRASLQLDSLPERVSHPSTALSLAGLVVLLLLLTLVRSWLKGPKGKSVLILGPCGSGKTTLFLQLRDSSIHQGTVASMQENVDTIPIQLPNGSSKLVQLVDVPGHPRVRGKFRTYLDKTRGIIYIVDAVDFTPHKTATAEQLYEVLEQGLVRKRRMPVLLVCNKGDQGAKAHTTSFIQKQFEKEIDQLRSTRRTLGDSAAADLLPKADMPFTFEALSKARGAQVSCCGASAKSGLYSFTRLGFSNDRMS
ncbi:hypothetical protein WJX84_007040 [Apatococcus fuscideae]|uniref:Signal recognition particle receptor subunit beta n=1 Tax=Apatococcus fuscideae TaxID=2026836 RepID=A0AAW1S0J0_9CHLO